MEKTRQRHRPQQLDTCSHTNGSNWGHLGHGSHRPSPKQEYYRFQDTGLRILGHSKKPGERDILVDKTYKGVKFRGFAGSGTQDYLVLQGGGWGKALD